VGFELRTLPGSHSVEAEFWVVDRVGRGKGRYHAAEARYWVRPISAPAPVDPDEEGWHSVASTASPWKRKIGGQHRGEVFYMTMRWENKSTGKEDGEAGKGEWAPMQSIVIQ
jgi:hypothetical protein